MIVLIVDSKIVKFWPTDVQPMQARRDLMDKWAYYRNRYPGSRYELAELVPDVFYEAEVEN